MTDKPTGEIQVILGRTRLVAAGRNQAMTKMIKLLARLQCRSYACTIWCSPTAGNCAHRFIRRLEIAASHDFVFTRFAP
jgi:hypothetical protein